jgi:hypothetical protein
VSVQLRVAIVAMGGREKEETMNCAREGYPEPVPGLLMLSTSAADLAISIVIGGTGFAVTYLAVYDNGTISDRISTVSYKFGDFPLSGTARKGPVVLLP